MKVNNIFLKQIIQEEIKNVLYEDHIDRNLVHLFVKYRNYLTKNPTDNKQVITNLEKDIKRIAPNKSGAEILASLEGKIDRQLFSFISNLLKRDKRMAAFSDKLDNYEMSISPDEQSVYKVYNKQDPDPGFMRVPKDDEAYDQEDVRKNIKTLVKEKIK